MLKNQLEHVFGDAISIIGEPTRTTTYKFDVWILENEEEGRGPVLLHSKKLGDGLVDSDPKFQKIVTKIRHQLETQENENE